MKNVKPKTPIMRSDYEFRAAPVRLQHVHPIGFEKLYAAPGDWAIFQPDAGSAAICMGRVIGLSTTPNNVSDPHGSGLFVMIAALGSRGQVMMRWIRPEWIAAALPGPPKRAMEFLCGEWDDPQVICDTIHNGLLEDYATGWAA